MGLRLVKIVRAHAWCPLGDEKKALTANELRLALHAALVARDSDAPEPWFQQSWQEIARALGHDRPDAKTTLNAITAAAKGLVEKGFWRVDKRAAGGGDGQQGRPVRYVITAWGALKDVPANGGNDSWETFPQPAGDSPAFLGTVYADSPELLGNDSWETVPNFSTDGPEISCRQSRTSRDLRSQEENKAEELSARSARGDAATIIQERTGCTSDEAAAVAADLLATRPHIRSLVAVLPSITDDELSESLDRVRTRQQTAAQRQAALALPDEQHHEYRDSGDGTCRVCYLPRANRRHQRPSAPPVIH